MAKPKDMNTTPLGVYPERDRPAVTAIELSAAAISLFWLALSGILSVALAFVIAFNIFAAAATLPGFLLAIELISTGVALLMLRRHQAAETTPATPETGTTSGVEYPTPRSNQQEA